MSTTTKIEEENAQRAAKIGHLIRHLRPNDKIIFETGGTGRIKQPHIVTEVAVEDGEYRVYTDGPQSGDYFLTDEAISSGPEYNEGPQLFIRNTTDGTNNPYPHQTRGEIRYLSLFAGEES